MTICPRCHRPTDVSQKDTGLCPYCVTGYRPFDCALATAVVDLAAQDLETRMQFRDWANPPEQIIDHRGIVYYLLADFSTATEHRYRSLPTHGGERTLIVIRPPDDAPPAEP